MPLAPRTNNFSILTAYHWYKNGWHFLNFISYFEGKKHKRFLKLGVALSTNVAELNIGF